MIDPPNCETASSPLRSDDLHPVAVRPVIEEYRTSPKRFRTGPSPCPEYALEIFAPRTPTPAPNPSRKSHASGRISRTLAGRPPISGERPQRAADRRREPVQV